MTIQPTVRAQEPSVAPKRRSVGVDPSTAVYLDHSATTPMDPSVAAAMAPFFTERFGNPSGAYGAGRKARVALEGARRTVAGLLGCAPGEVVFTSGGTESDNLALRGAAAFARRHGTGNHLVVTAVEHKAVLETADALALYGFEATVVAPDLYGRVAPHAVAQALRDDTVLVSVMLANNEVGTIEPVEEIASLARERGIVAHTDAVQGGAWLDLDVDRLGVDMMSLSAHKFYGPKGVGLLYVREGTPVEGIQTGGGQENGFRSGTENVAGAVGLAEALRLVSAARDDVAVRLAPLRDRLIAELEAVEGVYLTGARKDRLPGHVSVCVQGAPADTLLLGLDMRGICASSGSACSTGRLSASHVLTAMGVPEEDAQGALRITMGHHTSAADVERTADVLTGLIGRARQVAVLT